MPDGRVDRAALDEALLAAHATDDRRALVGLYRQAAEGAENEESGYFYLTQAYVFALETDHPERASIAARLRAAGRI